MFTTFNMGTGMILIADKSASNDLVTALKSAGEKAAIIGEVTVNTGSGRVEIL
jgi:phosphoribosylaminoimidazole (AIR) synthetase